MTLQEEIQKAEREAQIAESEAEARHMESMDPGMENSDLNLAKNLNRIGGTSRAILVNSPPIRALLAAAGAPARDRVKDVQSGLAGTFPGSSELMAQAGVPEGPKDPLLGKVSARGAGGFVLDAATDPTALLAKLLTSIGATGIEAGAGTARNMLTKPPAAAQAMSSALAEPTILDRLAGFAAKVQKVASDAKGGVLPSDGFKKLGKATFKSAYSHLDNSPELSSNVPKPSEVLWDGVNGKGKVWGSTRRSMGGDIEGTIKEITEANQEIASKASGQAPLVNQANAAKFLRERIGKAADNAMNLPNIPRWENTAAMYEISPPVNINKALEFAREARAAAKSAYGAGGGEAPLNAQMHQSIARGMMNEVGNSIAQIPEHGPPASTNFRANNNAIGSLMAVEPEAAAFSKVPPITAGDVAAGGIGLLLNGPMNAAKWVLLKKTLQGSVGPGMRSYGGRALHAIGNVPLSDQLMIQSAVHSDSPWTLMDSTQNGDNK